MRGHRFPLFKIGIIGGGQLAKMMIQSAKKMGFYVTVLDPTPSSPAGQVSDEQVVGDFDDEDKIKEVVEKSDITTYDIEHINVSALQNLVDKGYKIYPSPCLLEIIQDKLKQKDILSKNNIPTCKYQKIEEPDYIPVDYPCVNKSRWGGYDGRGVVVIKSPRDINKMIKGPSFIEEYVDIEKELGIMVARSPSGEIRCHPLVEMIFNEKGNICDTVIAPAEVSREIEEKAKEIAIKCVEVLEGVGIFGIEMFLTKRKEVLVNEIAPRPHNLGHYTIEACVTSQFEQHLRAICGLPLGDTSLLSPAVMVNLLGERGYSGEVVISGLKEALSIQGVSFHFYGKSLTKPFRKMGHVTVVDLSVEKAKEKAMLVKKYLKIKGVDKL